MRTYTKEGYIAVYGNTGDLFKEKRIGYYPRTKGNPVCHCVRPFYTETGEVREAYEDCGHCNATGRPVPIPWGELRDED